ncbi:hypothetical protein CR513_14921, partial [Mucuna pruriens]
MSMIHRIKGGQLFFNKEACMEVTKIKAQVLILLTLIFLSTHMSTFNNINEVDDLTFNIPPTELNMRRWISHVGEGWRGFKTQLNSNYIHRKYKDKKKKAKRKVHSSKESPPPYILFSESYKVLQKELVAKNLRDQPSSNYTSDPSKEIVESILRRAHREPLFPMVMKISSPLSLDDQSTLVMFGPLDECELYVDEEDPYLVATRKVYKFGSTMHHQTLHEDQDFDGSKKKLHLRRLQVKLSTNKLTINIDCNMLSISVNSVCQRGSKQLYGFIDPLPLFKQ